MRFDCEKSVHTWEVLPDGRIRLDGDSTPVLPWPSAVNQWRDLIAKASFQNDVPEAYIAATLAIESGGKPGACAKLKNGDCADNEGVGLMAIMAATATQMMKRTVTWQELLNDHALNIDAGTRYLKYQLGRYNGSFVHAAVGYNAGSVRCGAGKTWQAKGDERPRLPCPNDWGIVMGCLRGPNDTVVLTNYPEKAIKYLNAAIAQGYAPGPAGPPSPGGGGGPLIASAATGAPPSQLLWFGAAGAAAYAAMTWAKKKGWLK